MGTDDCIFCKMIAGEIPAARVYEDDIVLAFLDIGPVSDGHTLVIPKQHFGKLHDCPPELLGEVGSRLGKIAGAVADAMGSEGYNLLCNNGRTAGQLVEHLHFHIVPRMAEQPEEALVELNHALRRRDPGILLIGTWPMQDCVRSDPRFQELLRKINWPRLQG